MLSLQINNYTSVLFEKGVPKKIIWNISRGFFEGKVNMFNLEHLRQDAEKSLRAGGFVPLIDNPSFIKEKNNKLSANITLIEAVSKHRIFIIE